MTQALHVEAGNGDLPILFLHGLGGDAEYWSAELAHFGQSQRAVAWTMPGYGSSPALNAVTIETLAMAARCLLDRLDIDRAVVVGHSMGGFIAQRLAIDAPERVAGLALVSTTASFGKPGSSFNDEFLASRLAPLDEGMTPADLAPSVVQGLVAREAAGAIKDKACASMSRISADGYRAALHALTAWDGRKELGALDVPTRCIVGADDPTVPVASMKKLAALIPGADLDVISGASHLVNLEQPDRFRDVLASFLASLDG